MTGRVTAVVFDLGGVLLDWDPRHLYERLLPSQDMEWFLQNICTPQWHAANDLGTSTEAACRSLAGQWPEHARLIWAWHERGEEMVRGTLPDASRLGFRALRAFDHEQLVADLALVDLRDRGGRPVKLGGPTADQISS